MQMYANTLSTTPYPLTFPSNKRGNYASKLQHIIQCMECFTRSTTTQFFSGPWRNMNQRMCYKTCMIDPLGVTLQGTPLYIKACEPVSTRPHQSRMHMLIPTSAWSVSDAQQNMKVNSPIAPCCSDQTIPTMGPGHHWGYFSTFVKQHHYILTTTDYFTRWNEVVPLKKVNQWEVISFLQQNIISRLGVPV